MIERIIIAGSGGQGIMLLGKIIAQASLNKGYQVSWFPTYGAEVRGGTAYCMVIISSEDIPSPYIDRPDTLIIMNQPSLLRFKHRIKNKGLLLINSSLISSAFKISFSHKDREGSRKAETNYIYLPFTDTAISLGNIKVANMVALGTYIARKDILNKKVVFDAIEEIAPEEKRNLIEINKKAIEEGMRLVK